MQKGSVRFSVQNLNLIINFITLNPKLMKETEIRKVLLASINNLYNSQDQIDLDKFSSIVLECLMLLDRERYLKSMEGEKDRSNGAYIRSFRSLSKHNMQISIPRSRNGQFKPILLELLTRQRDQVNQLAMLLYRKGLSTRDVSEIMESFFGESMSRDTVNNLAAGFNKIRMVWEKNTLDAYYKVIYCDALYISLKRGNSYSKEALYVVYGVKDDNTRELLLLEINPTESSTIWGEFLSKLIKRGVEQVDLIVADGLPYFADVAKKYFREADVQRCVVHLQRGLLNKVRARDKATFAYDLKQVFNNFTETTTREHAMTKMKSFVATWQASYGKILQKLLDEMYIADYLTYIEYPVAVRRMIYTTNSIENLNRQIRKVTKTKVSFDQEDNLLDLVFMLIKDFEFNNWQRYPVHNFRAWPKNFAH